MKRHFLQVTPYCGKVGGVMCIPYPMATAQFATRKGKKTYGNKDSHVHSMRSTAFQVRCRFIVIKCKSTRVITMVDREWTD